MISQNLFQSIDTIISKRLHEVSFDITLICEVVEDTHKAQGQYTVKTDTMRFVAQGEENKYSVGQSVYVTVPQGNYSLQKVIIGAYNKDTAVPAKYLRPLDYLLPMVQSKLELGGDGKYTWSQPCDFAYFGVSFDVKYTGSIIEDGYGFEIFVDGQSVGKFDSSEFFGDPYNMFGFNQQKVFAAETAWNNITLVPYGVDASNVFSNVQIIAGPPQEETAEAKLEIIRIDANGGEVASGGEPELQAVFIAKDPTTGRYTTIYPDVSWYRWKSATHDFGAGIEWGKVLDFTGNTIGFPEDLPLDVAEFQGKTTEDEPISFTLNKLFDGVKEERFKAVYTDSNNEKHISNVITFTKPEENSKVDEDGNVIDDTSRALVLTIEGAEAKAYNIFGLDNSMVESVGRQTVVAKFANGDTAPSANAEIIWEVKNSDRGSMIQGLAKEDNPLAATFTINSWYFPSYINNTITCTINQNGITYIGSITPTFGYQGANGTTYRFNAERIEENNIRVTLQDSRGQYYDWTNMADKLEISYYSWWTIDANKVPIETTPTVSAQLSKIVSDDKKSVTITNAKPNEGFGIIEVKLTDWANPNGTLVDLNAHVIFPSSDNYTVQGATRIVYDYDGMNASYDQRPYKVNGESVVTVSENLVLSIEEKTQDGLTEYSPSIAYPVPTTLNDVYVKFTIGSEVLYQPILVLVNGYSSSVLNGWNGKLLVDNGNNRIMSASMIAGTKDINNLFTGVVMGDLKNVDLNSNESGLYGFDAGIRRFSLLTDGSFYVGDGDSYIKWENDEFSLVANKLNINANDGKFIINTDDADLPYLKITNGTQHITMNKSGQFTINSQYFQISSTGNGKIAGWNFDNNSIVNNQNGGNNYQNGTFMATGLTTGIQVYNPTIGDVETVTDGVFGAGRLTAFTIPGTTSTKNIKPFLVTRDGTVYCSKANITGAINATSGKVGGWKITDVLSATFQGSYGSGTSSMDSVYLVPGLPASDDIDIYNDYKVFQYSAYAGKGNTDENNIIIGNRGFVVNSKLNTVLSSGKAFTLLGSIPTDYSLITINDFTTEPIGLVSVVTNVTSSDRFYTPMQFGMIIGSSKVGIVIQQYDNVDFTHIQAKFIGTWSSESSTATDSDERVKNSINNLSLQYSTFFDSLQPVSYKYNNGSSDRVHVGFIAQQVQEALKNANIETQNFAGLCIPENDTDAWSLRYEEFIALNTSEIQKLKKQVTSLEDEVTYLKNIIAVTLAEGEKGETI